MWKPWIIVAVGTAMLTGAQAKISNPFKKHKEQPNNNIAPGLVEFNNDATFYDYANVEALENDLEEAEEAYDVQDEIDEEVEDEDIPEDVMAYDGEKQNWLERAVVETYKNMKAQFEGESKREVVQRIQKLGFENFVQDAEIKFIKNLQGKYFPNFSKDLLNSLNVDAKNKQKIQEFLEFAPFTSVGNWNMMRSMYSANSQSDANYICLMTYRDEQDRISVYQVNMKNSFKVAPDILILRESKSSWGGLFKSTSQKVVFVPHAMTPEDLQQLLDYFDLIALNRFMKLFGQAEVQTTGQDYADELDQVFADLADRKSVV